MNWQPVYALLIFGSTIITYFCGLLVDKHTGDRPKQRLFLILSLALNIGVLFIFKYYNFINDSVFSLLDMAGIRWPIPNFDILLPVGISFYTFQAVGYTIDVYRGDMKAERHFGIYALFVSFFPQLVAGPIERAKNLLGQFNIKHTFNFDAMVAGLKLMLWGYFMKLCVADRISVYVDAVYNNVGQHNGSSMLLATFLFAFQIYCDFGGYSLIAIGASKIMGFDLMTNFLRPYFAVSIKDFWRRWHISLSTWFKDYVYIPLGGSRVSLGRHLMNLLITFFISGLWHGANWTFVAWGAIHGIYLIVGVLKNKFLPKVKVNKWITYVVDIITTVALVMFGWIFFRANSINDAFEIIRKIFTESGPLFIDRATLFYGFISLAMLMMKDAIDEYGWKLRLVNSKYKAVSIVSASVLLCYILLCGVFDGGQFIYFQF